MAEVFTREAIGAILGDGALTDGDRAERLEGLFRAAVAEGKVRMEDGRAVTTPGAVTALAEQSLISGGL